MHRKQDISTSAIPPSGLKGGAGWTRPDAPDLAHTLAHWISTLPDQAATLRTVQREVPSRHIRRAAREVLAQACDMGLLRLLQPGAMVGGLPRREAWAACDTPASVPPVRHGPAEPCDTAPRLSPEAHTLLSHLTTNGPSTCGASATDLGISPTTVWCAERDLRAAGLIFHDNVGRGNPRAPMPTSRRTASLKSTPPKSASGQSGAWASC